MVNQVNGELSEWFELVERYGRLTIELEDCEEARHDYSSFSDACDELAESRLSGAQHPQHDNRLLTNAHQRGVEMVERNHGDFPGCEGKKSEGDKVIHTGRPGQLRRVVAVALLKSHCSGVALCFGVQS